MLANPENTTGSYNLRFYADGSGTYTINNAITVEESPAQSISNITASKTLTRNSILDVTISGNNTSFTKDPDIKISFHQGTNTSFYGNGYFPAPRVLKTTAKSDTKLEATIAIPFNAGTATYNLTMQGALSGELFYPSQLNVSSAANTPVATISGKSSAKRNETLDLTISGENLNMNYAKGNTIIFGQATNTNYYEGMPYGEFDVYEFEQTSNNTANVKVHIPEDIQIGFYKAQFFNTMTGLVSTNFDIALSFEMAAPDVELSPSFANAGDNLDVTISAKNMQFGQATAIIDAPSVKLTKSGATINLDIATFEKYQIVASANIPSNAPTGSYSLELNFPTRTSNITEIYEHEFVISKKMDSQMVNRYISTTQDQGNNYIKVDKTIFASDNLGSGITYRAQLASGAELPEWATFDASTMTLIIAKNRTKSIELLDIVILAEDSSGTEAAYNFSTEVMFSDTVLGNIETQTGSMLFPNPADNFITIKSPSAEPVSVEIATQTGIAVLNGIFDANNAIPIDNIPAGTYIARYTIGNETTTELLIVE